VAPVELVPKDSQKLLGYSALVVGFEESAVAVEVAVELLYLKPQTPCSSPLSPEIVLEEAGLGGPAQGEVVEESVLWCS